MSSRRDFLTGLAAAGALPLVQPTLLALAAERARKASPFARFRPILPSDRDDVVLPEGFRYDVVIKWGEPFTRDGEPFGYNNDYIGSFPLASGEEALLVVNHEYVSLAYQGDAALYPSTFRVLRGRRPTVADHKKDVGVSVVRVRRDAKSGAWTFVNRDRHNRRIDATSSCAVDGPAAPLMNQERLEGTFDNCSGQATPWGTALTCEENFQGRVPELVDGRGRYMRGGVFDLPGGHYGWIVEVDPYDPDSIPVKHTALGRFRHENVGLRVRPGEPVAGYMGDDRVRGHVWKFVSADVYRPGDAGSNRRLLSEGTLYVARFSPDGTGEWRPLALDSPLDPNPSEADAKPFIPPNASRLGHCYETLGAAVMDAYQAGNALGGTPSGRPEDLEVHPADGSVFMAFTALAARDGLFSGTFGEIWRLEEEKGDVRARRFRWTRFITGGPADPERAGRVIAHPDNLLFDEGGDLWIATDIAGAVINQPPDYTVFKNGGIFRAAVSGPEAAVPLQFASVPCECEPTGPCWSPGQDTLFLSVQHPGERYGIRTSSMAAPRGSNWPHGILGAPPQPAVIAIRPR